MVARLEEAQTALSNMQRAGNRHRQEAPDMAELSSSDDECNTIRTQQNQLIESLTASLQEVIAFSCICSPLRFFKSIEFPPLFCVVMRVILCKV